MNNNIERVNSTVSSSSFVAPTTIDLLYISGGKIKKRNYTIKCDCAPDLDEVLMGARGKPYSRKEFLQFLKQYHAEESFQFLLDVINKLQKPGIVASLVAGWIIDTYLIDEADFSINISALQREKCIKEVNALIREGEQDVLAYYDAFAECFFEIYTVLKQGQFQRFIQLQESTNIQSFSNKVARYAISAFGFAFVVASIALSLHVNKFTSLLIFPASFVWILYWISAQTMICDYLAYRHLLHSATNSIYNAYFKQDDEITDEYAVKQIQKRSIRQLEQAFLISLIISILWILAVFIAL
jgi:hypothetical protein